MKLTRLACWMIASLALAAVCHAQTPARSGAPLVTMEDIQQDFDSQKYADVIRKLVPILQIKGPNAAQYDKVKLYALKAESHLRLKQYIPAADAFTLAAKETTDEKEIGIYKSTAMLLRRSTNGQYTPKQQPAAQAQGARPVKAPPIPIIETASRKQAMAAMFEDELAIITPKVAAANKQPVLPPLMAAINEVRDLRMLELTATDSDSNTVKLLGTIETRAAQLMGAAVKSMSTTVEKIAKTANEGSSYNQDSPYGGTRTVSTKRGLTSTDSDTLTEAVDTSNNIVAACEELIKVLPPAKGKADHAIAKVSTDASKLSTRAGEVLHADYGTAVNDIGGNMLLPVQPVKIPRSGTR